MQIIKLKVKPELHIRGNEPSFVMNVSVTGKLLDNRTNADISDPVYIDQMGVALEKEMKRVYESLFEKLQRQYKVDSAGLGTMIYRKKPKLWKKMEKDWQEELYAEQKIDWRIDATIGSVGSAGANLFLPESELKK